jgi:dye decolorizing peroxidase
MNAPNVGRRWLITGGVLAVGSMATAAVTAPADGSPGEAKQDNRTFFGQETVSFHGAHQAGVLTPPPAHGTFIALALLPGTTKRLLGNMMRLLSDDAARLTAGLPALADTEPELALAPGRLTVTFGFGPEVFAIDGLESLRPSDIEPLPRFGIDRLEPRWSGGDVLIQLCADDPMAVAHAQRMLIKDARPFATVAWVQKGFRNAAGSAHPELTQRNVMGQLDGTIQPPLADRSVWVGDGPAWFHGGTTLVLRRIRAELETWDAVEREGKEHSVGRRLADGAPLTGHTERDPVDLTAKNSLGLPVISTFAHVRRAHVADENLRILRRPYNYDDGLSTGGLPDTGIIFASYQASVAKQFLPIQRALDESDLLNEWTTPIGSAVFAIPPGCAPGQWIGQTLLG